MSATVRDPFELIPAVLGILSAILFFGLPSELNGDSGFLQGWYHPVIVSSIPAVCAILFGIRYIIRKGANGVVWVGVLVSIIVLMLNLVFLLAFYVWENIGF